MQNNLIGDLTINNLYYILKLSRTILVMKKIMNEMGINFYPKNGTLLGLLRNGFPIPINEDVDLVSFDNMSDLRFDEFTKLVEEYGLIMFQIEAHYHHGVRTVGAYIRGDNIIATGIEFWGKIEDNYITYDGGLSCPKRFFEGEKRQIDFLGEKFCIPPDSEGFLEFNYGKNWRIPAVSCIVNGKGIWVKCDINKNIIEPIEIIDDIQSFDRVQLFRRISLSSSSSSLSSSSSSLSSSSSSLSSSSSSLSSSFSKSIC